MGWLAPIPSSCSPCYPPCPHPLGKGINSLQCPLLAEAWLGYLGAPLWPEFLPPVAPPAGRTSLVRSGSVTAEHHCPGTPPPLTCCQKGFFGGAVGPCPTFHRGIAPGWVPLLGSAPPTAGRVGQGLSPPSSPRPMWGSSIPLEQLRNDWVSVAVAGALHAPGCAVHTPHPQQLLSAPGPQAAGEWDRGVSLSSQAAPTPTAAPGASQPWGVVGGLKPLVSSPTSC